MFEDLPGSEVGYVLLLFVLVVVPRVMIPLRIPAAVSALALGAAFGLGAQWFVGDETVVLLGTFGIVSLFLLAGLEVEFGELRREWRMIGWHLAERVVLFAVTMWVVGRQLDLGPRMATVVSLALMTPSTGFILDSLGAFGLKEAERFWVKSYAISSEVLALLVLFVVMQAGSATQLGQSSIVLMGMLLLVPLAYWMFSRTVARWAPRSEFAFVMLVAVVCALGTKKLGVYYLVGAFVAGLGARAVRHVAPDMSSPALVHALELFASFFVPFYFFRAGTNLNASMFTWASLELGLLFLFGALLLRVAANVLVRQLLMDEPARQSLRIALPLLPTVVFTLVLAGILRDEFGASPTLVGALVVYALGNTILPGLIIGKATPTFDAADADLQSLPLSPSDAAALQASVKS